RKYSIKTGAALRGFIRVVPDVMARAKEMRRDPFEAHAIRDAIKPWAERLRDRRFETEGEWKLKLAGGTRGTVELLARELRAALRESASGDPATKPLVSRQLWDWIDEHRHAFEPPVGNKVIWEDSQFTAMVIHGPNARRDFHVDPSDEIFYMLRG